MSNDTEEDEEEMMQKMSNDVSLLFFTLRSCEWASYFIFTKLIYILLENTNFFSFESP